MTVFFFCCCSAGQFSRNAAAWLAFGDRWHGADPGEMWRWIHECWSQLLSSKPFISLV